MIAAASLGSNGSVLFFFLIGTDLLDLLLDSSLMDGGGVPGVCTSPLTTPVSGERTMETDLVMEEALLKGVTVAMVTEMHEMPWS